MHVRKALAMRAADNSAMVTFAVFPPLMNPAAGGVKAKGQVQRKPTAVQPAASVADAVANTLSGAVAAVAGDKSVKAAPGKTVGKGATTVHTEEQSKKSGLLGGLSLGAANKKAG